MSKFGEEVVKRDISHTASFEGSLNETKIKQISQGAGAETANKGLSALGIVGIAAASIIVAAFIAWLIVRFATKKSRATVPPATVPPEAELATLLGEAAGMLNTFQKNLQKVELLRISISEMRAIARNMEKLLNDNACETKAKEAKLNLLTADMQAKIRMHLLTEPADNRCSLLGQLEDERIKIQNKIKAANEVLKSITDKNSEQNKDNSEQVNNLQGELERLHALINGRVVQNGMIVMGKNTNGNVGRTVEDYCKNGSSFNVHKILEKFNKLTKTAESWSPELDEENEQSASQQEVPQQNEDNEQSASQEFFSEDQEKFLSDHYNFLDDYSEKISSSESEKEENFFPSKFSDNKSSEETSSEETSSEEIFFPSKFSGSEPSEETLSFKKQGPQTPRSANKK